MSQQQQTPVTKSVRFADTARMRLALHVNNYTDEEFEACFYSREDFKQFKQEINLTVRMMDMKREIDETYLCARGLEIRARKGGKRRSKARKAACLAVFGEQMRQSYFQEEHDDVKIAAKYAQCTEASAKTAYITGLSDELVATSQEKTVREVPPMNVTCQFMKLRRHEGSVHVRRNIYNRAA